MGSKSRIKGWVETDKRIFAYQGDEKRSTAQETIIHKPTDQADALGTAHVPKIILSASGPAKSTGGAERSTATTGRKRQQATLGKFDPMRSPTSTFSARDFLARASRLLESEGGSRTLGGRSITRYAGLLGLKDLRCFSLRMFKDSYRPTPTEISPLSSNPWGSWGMMRSGRCLTARASEYPRGAAACSLSDILEESVPKRYFLSEKQMGWLAEKSMDEDFRMKLVPSTRGTGRGGGSTPRKPTSRRGN